MRKWIVIILVFLCGCCSPESGQAQQIRFVEKITVTRELQEQSRTWVFSQQEQMNAVLDYLRMLSYGEPLQGQAGSLPGTVYRIVVQLSDGRCKEYTQKGNLYLQVDGGPWYALRAKQAQKLPELLETLE